jgi:chemotaxis protein MotB
MSKRRHKGGHDGGHENAERWLLTYADLITLLMVFFVVLYSMSQADSTKFKRISAALQSAFNVDVLQGQSATSISDGSPEPPPPVDDLISNSEVPQVTRLQNKIQSVLDGAAQSPDVQVGTDKEGIVIRLSGSYLFDSGRAELKPNSLGVLEAIASELRPLGNEIRVDGHTDSTPIESPRYPTNWELSAARALAVTRYLSETDAIPAGRLMAAGFGEFRPIAPNDSREHRALNRRVEIHLLSSAPPDAVLKPLTPQPDTQTSTEHLES